jgi:UDP-N-acetylmuramyl pentapeptide phosphotransferase/UDP-N-acetylglucosamine-1-phosphate transferase
LLLLWPDPMIYIKNNTLLLGKNKAHIFQLSEDLIFSCFEEWQLTESVWLWSLTLIFLLFSRLSERSLDNFE